MDFALRNMFDLDHPELDELVPTVEIIRMCECGNEWGQS